MTTTTPRINIDPKAIQGEASKSKGISGAKASTFNAYMGSVNAMGPFAGELTYQTSGNTNAATVLSAAFSSFPAAASAFAGGGGMGVPSYAGGYGGGSMTGSQVPGLAGGPGMMRAAYTTPGLGDPNAPVSADTPGFKQGDLVNTLNKNNMDLLELQAIMQANMQTWTTKSNVLAADHRAKMSLIEKFNARG